MSLDVCLERVSFHEGLRQPCMPTLLFLRGFHAYATDEAFCFARLYSACGTTTAKYLTAVCSSSDNQSVPERPTSTPLFADIHPNTLVLRLEATSRLC